MIKMSLNKTFRSMQIPLLKYRFEKDKFAITGEEGLFFVDETQVAN